ncbi:DUF5060 domain-containing protein [Planctomycetota bacterium]
MKYARLCLIPAMIFTVPTLAFSQEILIPRWQPHNFSFQSQTQYDNPFLVNFSATVTRPDGKEFTAYGFYNGGGTWIIRLAPDMEGKWSLRTHSKDAALAGKTLSFICIKNQNPNIHGGLRVDPRHRGYFIFEDGTRYFLMGYECDWLWALDMNNPVLSKLNTFLDKLAAFKFNHIILNAYAHDTNWRKGKTGDDDFGPPPMYAWQGSNEKPDHSRFNLDYWQHYDRVKQAKRVYIPKDGHSKRDTLSRAKL